jgi:hypothetical protein
MPLFCAVVAIFSPCSSDPVMKIASLHAYTHVLDTVSLFAL